MPPAVGGRLPLGGTKRRDVPHRPACDMPMRSCANLTGVTPLLLLQILPSPHWSRPTWLRLSCRARLAPTTTHGSSGVLHVRHARRACALLARCVEVGQQRRSVRSRVPRRMRHGIAGATRGASSTVRTSHLAGCRRPRGDSRRPQRLHCAVCEHARDHRARETDAPADQWCRQSGSASRSGGPKRRSTPHRSAGDTEDGRRAGNASHGLTTLLPSTPPNHPSGLCREECKPRAIRARLRMRTRRPRPSALPATCSEDARHLSSPERP